MFFFSLEDGLHSAEKIKEMAGLKFSNPTFFVQYYARYLYYILHNSYCFY